MCRDAELPARTYLGMATAAVAAGTGVDLAEILLRQAAAAVRRYTDPAWRRTGLETLAGTVRGLLLGAEPGSDAQLLYAQVLADVAISAADLALLTGLLDGAAPVPGLAVDPELRWSVLHRLVSRGAAGEARIEAEAVRDRTAAGERQAASCRAAVPDAAAKRAAWDLLTGAGPAGSLPFAVFRAVLTGFADPDQQDLLEPYVAGYFDVVGRAWRDWSPATAKKFVTGGYPAAVITPATVEATDGYLRQHRPPAALARLLAESRDELVRALRARDRDRTAGGGRAAA
jgi:aminopeptidase N